MDALLLLGACHYQRGEYAACVAANDAAIVADPGLAEAHANLANALQQLGDVDAALVYYQSALRLKPRFTDALNNAASALVAKGLVPAAMECYAAALAVNPGLVGGGRRGGEGPGAMQRAWAAVWGRRCWGRPSAPAAAVPGGAFAWAGLPSPTAGHPSLR